MDECAITSIFGAIKIKECVINDYLGAIITLARAIIAADDENDFSSR